MGLDLILYRKHKDLKDMSLEEELDSQRMVEKLGQLQISLPGVVKCLKMIGFLR